MAFRWKNITVTRTNCGADVFGLAGFLREEIQGAAPGLLRVASQL